MTTSKRERERISRRLAERDDFARDNLGESRHDAFDERARRQEYFGAYDHREQGRPHPTHGTGYRGHAPRPFHGGTGHRVPASARSMREYADPPEPYSSLDAPPMGEIQREISPHGWGHWESPTRRDPGAVGIHAGKGPKGYRRAPETIVDDVSRRLEEYGEVDASEIEVSCADGIVTLKGKVEDRTSKRCAEDCADEVYGVRDVMNELHIDTNFFARPLGSSRDRDASSS